MTVDFRRHGLCIVLAAALWMAFALTPRRASAQDPLDDQGVSDIIQELHNDNGDKWWDATWKYRRKVTIDDAKLLNTAGAIALQDPDPLLLYNTGRAQASLADLRVMMRDGAMLPCGVTNFGRDDGSSQIWCVPPPGEPRTKLELVLYYGNPEAKATGDTLPEGGAVSGDPQNVRMGAEEVRAGPPDSEQGSFFKNLVVVEAETLTSAANKEQCGIVAAPGASGGAVLVLKPHSGAPLDASATVTIPVAGRWRLHVRFKTFEGNRRYAPFAVTLGGKEMVCQAGDNEGAFAWSSTTLELPQGDARLGVHCLGPAAPDVIVLTQDEHYLPDYRDVNGPVWMRFQVTNKIERPFYVDLFCYRDTYTANGEVGATAGYLFRDRTVAPKVYEQAMAQGSIYLSQLPSYDADLPKDPKNLLGIGDWTPWCVTPAHGSDTWHSQARFMGAGMGLTVAYQFATRPDSTRVFRSGTEDSGRSNYIGIHMPLNMDLKTVRASTLSYSDWAAQRFDLTRDLGFKPNEGPKSIVFGTMATAHSQAEAEQELKTFNWLGINTLTLNIPDGLPDYAGTLDKGGVPGTWEYARSQYRFLENNFYTVDTAAGATDIVGRAQLALTPISTPPGMSATQFVNRTFLEKVDEDYKARAMAMRKANPWTFDHMRYNDLDDEIGAIVTAATIDEHPVFRGYWIEYLRAHGLQPSTFGVAGWNGVKAIGYDAVKDKREANIEQIRRDTDAATRELENRTLDPAQPDALDDRPEKDAATVLNPVAAATADVAAPAPDPGKLRFEKREYLWTQRFRSMLTALFYHAEAAAVTKYFPPGVHTCPNLQAMPIQNGQMWDGSLNIYDFARLGGCTSVQIEDWWGSPLNVRYGMDLARNAARKQGQQSTLLAVGGTPGNRVVAALMEGTRNFLFYLYGPVHNIGPAWAEDVPTLKSIGLILRKVARAEPDILAAKPRRREAAILVSNDAEINQQYYQYPVGRERLAVFSALDDAQIPVDMLGEEEVIEDDALKDYKVLYVTDPQVDERAQKKIREWVAAGGTLWSDYAGLARTEYDEPSPIMNEVFGLRQRGDLVAYPYGGYGYADVPMGPTVTVAKSEFFDPDAIPGIEAPEGNGRLVGHHAETDYQLSTGKVLGTFGDGKPAIVYNKYGKGQAFLCGFLAGLSYTGAGNGIVQRTHGAFSTPLRGQLMTVPARLAGVRPFVTTTAHELLAGVHDGPHQTVLFLVNDADAAAGGMLRVSLPIPPTSAYSAGGRAIDFKMEGNEAVLPFSLAAEDNDIIVFKY